MKTFYVYDADAVYSADELLAMNADDADACEFIETANVGDIFSGHSCMEIARRVS
jgi:hypothetical protein